MSGHNKWSQIKHRKGAQDAKKSAIFSKILAAISIAAKTDPKPESNQRLRTLIEKARSANVPNDNIERALKRASEAKDLKEFVMEAYGPEKTALIIEAITDNSNRTVQELRKLVTDAGAKVADPGSVLWAFTQEPDETGRPTWTAKFFQPVSDNGARALQILIETIESHEEVQRVATNAQNPLV